LIDEASYRHNASAVGCVPWRRLRVLCPGEGNARREGLRDASYAAAEKTMGLEQLVALVAAIGAFSMTPHRRRHVPDRSAGQ
jgi:hypothetical protein